jgi:hypothetical protein
VSASGIATSALQSELMENQSEIPRTNEKHEYYPEETGPSLRRLPVRKKQCSQIARAARWHICAALEALIYCRVTCNAWFGPITSRLPIQNMTSHSDLTVGETYGWKVAGDQLCWPEGMDFLAFVGAQMFFLFSIFQVVSPVSTHLALRKIWR